MTKTKSRLAIFGTVAAMAVALVAQHEGLRTTAYKDIVGVPTVCFGETRGVEMGDTYTKAQCEQMLGVRLEEFAKGMEACLTQPYALPEKTYVAFLSLSYNIGTGAFCKSTVVRRANAGDLKGACNAILMWDKAGGKQVRGLVRRRAEERSLCLASL